MRFFTKRGYFTPEQEFKNDLATDEELLPRLQSASIASRIALGERHGQRVRSFGEILSGKYPEVTGQLFAQIDGFSLHASVYFRPWERDKLEKLCRYVARPAVAAERLSVQGNGNIVYKLKKPYWDRTSHLLFSPQEFMEKLAALVPLPRAHFQILTHLKLPSEIPQIAPARSPLWVDYGAMAAKTRVRYPFSVSSKFGTRRPFGLTLDDWR